MSICSFRLQHMIVAVCPLLQLVQVLQLHLACEQRIGVILVGPSGAGKSTLWQVLEQGYDMLGRKPVVYRVNPKAMPRQQLLGSLNMDTREWTDGVITAAARKVWDGYGGWGDAVLANCGLISMLP